MKLVKTMPWLMTLLVAVVMTSCGPSYVGVRTAPNYGYGPGYYGAQPYYGGYYRNPYRSYRAPVIVRNRTYVVPRRTYTNPNARSYNNSRSNTQGGSRGYSPRSGTSGGSRGPR